MKRRLAPFGMLLEAHYAPLLFAVLPQAYAVYRWLWLGSDRSDAAWLFAIAGGVGYEAVYIGAIAWAELGNNNRWTKATAWIALAFSIAVAVYVHLDQGWWSLLHAGFPLVAFSYSQAMHRATAPIAAVPAVTSQDAPQHTKRPDRVETPAPRITVLEPDGTLSTPQDEARRLVTIGELKALTVRDAEQQLKARGLQASRTTIGKWRKGVMA